ncbi:MAG: tetratricopeptide repeat protein [Gammaproteobacteria bacterium]|nr:tetratricopeptide repeat protein [Gammaproteobacteria bacterium]
MSNFEERVKGAKALFEKGESEAARLDLLKLLQEQPHHPTVLLMLGGAYFHEQKYAEAQLVYERLLRIEPGSGLLSIALFNTLWQQGKQAEAAAEIHRFITTADPVTERETLKQYASLSQAIAAGATDLDA